MKHAVRRFTGIAAAALFGTLVDASAFASDADVTSDTSAQFYDVRSPTGQTVLMRRRVTSSLGVAEYNMLDAPAGDPHAGQIDFRARLRYDADYGVSCAESTPPTSAGSCSGAGYGNFIPGAAQSGVDLMYAYVEGRRFFDGLLGFKLGRQYQTDVLGWWSFDGAEVSVTTPMYIKAEVYGGLEERGGLPLSTSRFEADGVWRGDRTSIDSSAYSAYQPSNIAPAIGAAIESTGVTWIHGRLSYRRVYDTGGSNVSEFASGLSYPATYNGTRISTERLGYAMDTSLAQVGGLRGGLVFDLYRNELTSGYASLDAYLGTKVTVSLDYDYYVPSFDADSIWNFFAGEGHNDFGLRANVDLSRELSIAANGHARMFTVETAASPNNASLVGSTASLYPSNGHPFDEGGDLSARWKNGDTRIALVGRGDFGDEGRRAGADVSAEHVFETRYVVAGRLGVWNWDDKLQPDRSTTSFQANASVGYKFMPRSQATIDGEDDINGLVGQRFRLMLLLSLGLGK